MEQTTPEGISDKEYLTLCLEYDLWIMDGACTHELMCIACERVSNWAGLREFQHALRCAGENRCAALLKEIPDINGGMTTPSAAKMCLAELDHFCSLSQFGTTIELIDDSSSEVIHSRVEAYDGWFATNNATKISFRLNIDGTFQIERGEAGLMAHDAEAQVLFRSRAFSQAKTSNGEFCFTDSTSGEQLACSSGLLGVAGNSPALFKVRQRADVPTRYTYCVEPLRRVFQAAIDTNHPVLWM